MNNNCIKQSESNSCISTAILIKDGEEPFSINIAIGNKEKVKECSKKFEEMYKDSNTKVIDINIRKETESDFYNSIVKKYNNIINKNLKDTCNGNFSFILSDIVNVNEEKIFMKILSVDKRISDIEFNEKSKLLDIIAYLDYCTNIENETEDEYIN